MDQEELKIAASGNVIDRAGTLIPTSMTQRERWHRIFQYQKVDRVPHYEFGYWAELYAEWHEQGLPRDIVNEWQANRYFGFDDRWSVPVNVDILPHFEYEVLHEDERHRLIRDTNGTIAEINKDGSSSIPHYVEFPIKGRADWERFRERLDPKTPGRLPGGGEQWVERAARSDVPVGINIGSLFGRLRDWMGFETIAVMVYDDPDLIDEMVETMCNLIIETIIPILKVCPLDFAGGWEDMAFNNGPIISPRMFRQFLVPRYKRIADLLHQHGVHVIWTDCDGNITQIVGLWLEAGYNCIFPIEVRAGSDPVALRRQYGKELLMLGGFDKMALLRGPEAILAELKRLEPVVEEGGFVPHVDHRTPAGVTLENYRYYLREKKALLGFPPEECR